MAAAVARRPEPVSHLHQDVSQSMRDVVDEKYRDLRRPRKIKFYCNGDRYFKGKVLFITPHRYLSYKDLLTDLTAKMPSAAHLPYGVRKLYHSVTGAKVRSIEELQDGGDYVCSGFDSFKSIKYGAQLQEPWSFGRQADQYAEFESDFDYRFRPGQGASGPSYSRGLYGPGGFAPGRTLRQTYPRRLPNAGVKQSLGPGQSDNSPNKPKVVTVVRNGARPRKKVTILLNRRSVQSFEQLVADISEALGSPRWKNNRVRKLYTLKGREVQGVSDFFRDDDVFIALGTEQISTDQVGDILEDLYPDNPYAKNLLKEWEKSRRRKRGPRPHVPALHGAKDQQDPNGDSGYGGDGDSSQDGEDRKRKGKPRRWDHTGKEARNPAYPTTQAEDAALKMEQERAKASHEERDRAHRREQKRKEAEKRAVEEERRKQGLVHVFRPADDPFKKMNDRAKEKERERKRREEEERRRKEEEEREKRRAEEEARERERKAKEEKEREEAEARRQAEENARRRAEQAKLEEEKKSKDENDKEEGKEGDANEPKTNEVPREKKTRAQVMKENKLRRQVSDNQPVLDKYDLGRVLGDGNFAIVKDAKLKKMPSMTYAIKIIDKSKMRGKEHMIENEIQIMKDCNHTNICRLYEEYETGSEIYLVMELVKGGDLFDAITQSIKFSEFEAAFMVRDLAQALFYLHSRKIVHRDMKPENLLVVRNNKDTTISLKLADFGLAMEVHEEIYTVCGTPTYVAPEILQETGYGLEVDLWALGVITYILLCGFPPFRSPDRKQTELFEFIKAGEFEYLKPYWDNISDSAKDLINHLLVVDIKKRYTAIDLLCHPWLISLGGSQELPDNLTDYRRSLRLDLERQARAIYKEYHNMYKRKTSLVE